LVGVRRAGASAAKRAKEARREVIMGQMKEGAGIT
jgi:hypothetical protein